ncbi:hypothetical protein GCM10011611_19880 [Aliidongia dinghuensis]|uniref:Uncharacterized protein n=1 Tax=Aliidongia dinghuensis TaxID=1867774 RepID=A0A8J2YS11_9PROT|nr:hypothetical protein [Aliidongia dinghuensis]GGF14144.1 hypothetical protein GCM10011611_19880 [Aliidongia dinghuensis]
MATIYVARSASLSDWASDVGLSKHVYKVGVTDEDPKALAAAGWAGFPGWTLVKQAPADGLSDEAAIEKLAGKVKMIDPALYPKIKGVRGIFKVTPAQVENHIVVTRALEGSAELVAPKLKPADFAAFLIHNALR